ncbi:MAG: peptidylprolyl isomerase [Bacillota bacterium]|nr:peptidylprolyl isomerase [Bacillota bacterium]
MKKIAGVFLSLALVVGLAACGTDGAKGADKKAPESIGTVNGVELDVAKYQMFYDMYLGMIAKQQMLSENIQSMLVDEAVVLQDLEKNKVEISKDVIDKVRKEMTDNMGGEALYKEQLAQDGVSEEAFEALVMMKVSTRVHKDWYRKEHPKSKEDIAKYYEEHKNELDTVRVSHILVDSEQKANELKAKIDAGEDFAKLAKENSVDEMTKIVGGDLGELSIEYSGLDPKFLEAVKTLKPGEVSKPVKSQFGYHVIKLVSKKEGVEEVKDRIEEILVSEEYFKYVKELKDSAIVKKPGEEEPEKDAKEEPATDAKEEPAKEGEEKKEESK